MILGHLHFHTPQKGMLMGQEDRGEVTPGAYKRLALELSRYLTASVIGTVAHYCLMMALVYLASVDEVVASTYGAILGAVIIYVLNYYVTFQSTKKHQVAATRFALVAVLSVVMNGVILKGLLTWFDWHTMLLQGITTLLVFSLTYVLNRTWTF